MNEDGLDVLAIVVVYAAVVIGWAFVVGRRKLHSLPKRLAFFPAWVYPLFGAAILWRAWVSDILGPPIIIGALLAGPAIYGRLQWIADIGKQQEERVRSGK